KFLLDKVYQLYVSIKMYGFNSYFHLSMDLKRLMNMIEIRKSLLVSLLQSLDTIVRIYFSSSQAAVPQKFFYDLYISSLHQQMRGDRMPQRMRTQFFTVGIRKQKPPNPVIDPFGIHRKSTVRQDDIFRFSYTCCSHYFFIFRDKTRKAGPERNVSLFIPLPCDDDPILQQIQIFPFQSSQFCTSHSGLIQKSDQNKIPPVFQVRVLRRTIQLLDHFFNRT